MTTVGAGYRQILDALADPVIAADASNCIVYANQAVEELLGWPAAELIGQPLSVIQPERFRQTHLNGFRRFLATRVPRVLGRPLQVSALRRDGSELAVDVNIAALPEGSNPVVVATLRDRRDRLALEQAEQRFAFLAEASRVLASSLDYRKTLSNVARLAVPHLADWCVVDIVDEAGEIRRLAVTHIDPAKMELAREATQRYPPDRAFDSAVYRVVETGEPLLAAEIPDEALAQSARDAGHLAILREIGLTSYMCVPLVAHGRVRGAIGFVSAESRRRYTEEDLNLAQDLARRAAIAVDNAVLYAELNEAVRIRDEFLSSVSHDLKNPIAAIKGRAQMLERRLNRLPPEEVERFAQSLGSIDSSATRMTRLINDLVDVARLRIGQPLTLQIQPTDLIALVRSVAEEVQQSTDIHNIRIVVDPELESLVGNWDPSRIERVLVNLLTNAVKYSPQGRDIDVVAGEEMVEAEPWAVVQVHDRGIGIPPEDLPRIFQRYHRGSNVGEGFEGTGVGLAAARQIVAQHRGTIAVAGREGGGSTFTVRLPVS